MIVVTISFWCVVNKNPRSIPYSEDDSLGLDGINTKLSRQRNKMYFKEEEAISGSSAFAV